MRSKAGTFLIASSGPSIENEKIDHTAVKIVNFDNPIFAAEPLIDRMDKHEAQKFFEEYYVKYAVFDQ